MDNPADDAKLFRALQLVNDWLKFGEAKNGVLVTLNGVAIVGMHNVVKLYGPLGWLGSLWLWTATVCCLVSLAIGLSSFYARTNIRSFLFVQRPPEDNGVIYFGHLAGMNKDEVLRRLVGEYEALSDKPYLEDMAGQVIINAKLARKKFHLFNVALFCALAGTLTPVGLLLYYWGFCDDNP